jgi:hypothetical protein
MLVGVVSITALTGVRLVSVGATLSMVMTALSDEAVDGLLSASMATPASTLTVTVPEPWHALSVTSAPVAESAVTDTVHDGTPVTVMPPPLAVSKPVSAVPPAREGVSVSARDVVPNALIRLTDGAPRDAVGPAVRSM